MLHVPLDRVSPMAVPVLVIVGQERTASGSVDDHLLMEAETLAEAAMRLDQGATP
jgi:ATP-dependent Lhr-like helicase